MQADADSAVLDAASLLGVPRHQLGIVGAAKGLLAGRFRFRVRFVEPDGQGPQGPQGPAVAVGGWQDCSTGTLVDSDWVSERVDCNHGWIKINTTPIPYPTPTPTSKRDR